MSLYPSVQIGEIIRHAIAFKAQNWQGTPMTSDSSIIQSAQDFFSILEQRYLKYVLAGGIALLYYIEGRNTQDLDLLMPLLPTRYGEVVERTGEIYPRDRSSRIAEDCCRDSNPRKPLQEMKYGG